MHIEERGEKTFLLTWELGRDPVTGRRRQKRKTFHGTKNQAQQAWMQEQLRQEQGAAVDDRRMTLTDWAREWVEVKADRWEPSTLQTNLDYLHNLVLPALGAVRLQQLRPQHIQDALTTWRATPKKQQPKRREGPPLLLSPRAVQICYDLVAGMLDQAVKWQLVDRNVARLVDRPRVRAPERHWWDLPTMERFLAAVGSHREGIAFALGLFCGLRRGEICGLRWEAIDWTARTLTVTKTRVLVHGRALEKDRPKSAAGHRTVPIPDGLVQWLKIHHAGQQRLKLAQPDGRPSTYDDQGYVIQTAKGTPTNPRNLDRTFARICERIQAPKIALHDLRHTFASQLVDQGANIRVVADLLGHTRVSFTLQTYVHGSVATERATVDQLGRRIQWAQNGHISEASEPETRSP